MDAIAYSFLNVGVNPDRKRDATFLLLENVGINPDKKTDATFLVLENVGFELPPRVDIVQPQQGWGIPLVPEREVTMFIESAKATAYTYENVVEETPTP